MHLKETADISPVMSYILVGHSKNSVQSFNLSNP